MNDATASSHQTLSRYHVHHRDPDSAKWELGELDKALRKKHESVNRRHRYYYLAGRLLIALLFVASAVAKITRFDDAQRTLDSFGLSATDFLLTIAIPIELVVGIMVGIGYKV